MDEDTVQAAAAQYEQIQQRLQGLDQHLSRLEQALREIDLAKSTLSGLTDGDQETLVPIGGGIRLHAAVDGSKPVFMDLGSGTTVETTAATALERLQARRESTQGAYQAADQEADRLARKLQEIQQSLSASS